MKKRKNLFFILISMLCILMSVCTVQASEGTPLSPNTVTENRTMEDVYNLYKNSIESYSISEMFDTQPVLTAGSYNPGKLSDDAVNKTVSQINYFRKLAGLNDNLIAYTDRLEYGQCGATGMEIVKSLTHEFTEDQKTTLGNYMSENQLNQAIAGIGAGKTDSSYKLWNANCSSTNNVVTSIQGYMDDTNNVKNGVGHRLNMLDINGQAVVMGAGKSAYSCVSIYGSPYQTSNPNTQDYYPWPCEGYFPKQNINDNAKWSVIFNQAYSAGTVGVKVSYKGIEYSCTPTVEVKYNGKYVTIYYILPDTVKSAIKSSQLYSNNQTVDVTVKVTGLKNSSGNAVYAEYTTKLFKRVPVTSVNIAKISTTLEKGQTENLSMTYAPSDATNAGEIRWSSSNPSVATVDATTGAVNSVGVGETTITASIGNIKDTCTVKVVKKLTASDVADITAQIYTGSAITPALTVKDGDTVLTKDTDYTVKIGSNTNVGKGEVTVSGKGNYTGTVTKNFTISPKQLNNGALSTITAQTYTGKTLKPAVVVSDGTKILKVTTDYTVTNEDAVNAGTYGVKITLKGNYTGTLDGKFTVNPKMLTKSMIQIPAQQDYTGSEITPEVAVKDFARGVTLSEDADYTVVTENTVNVSKNAKVTVTGKGNYSDSVSLTFEIKACDISKAIDAGTVTVKQTEKAEYSGKSMKPAVSISRGTALLKEGTDYTLTYGENVNVKEAFVTIEGMGNYQGSKKVDLVIDPKVLSEDALDVIESQTYTGKVLTPKVIVSDGSKVLEKDADYTVTCKDAINAGQCDVTVTFEGNYKGTLTGVFTILPRELQDGTVDSIPDQAYTGSAIIPEVVVRDGSTIVKKSNYTVTATNNIQEGTATVLITLKGNYTGSLSADFTIVPRKAVETPTVTPVPTTKPTTTPAASPKVGSSYKVSGGNYKVTGISSSKLTVAYIKPVSKTASKITIPDTVKIKGKNYKVTEIRTNAFKNHKSVKTIVIGKNVTSIKNGAFYGCKKLKTITIKSAKLKSVGKDALKNTNKKVKIKVPKKQLKAYKKLFSKKTGYVRTMQIVK